MALVASRDTPCFTGNTLLVNQSDQVNEAEWAPDTPEDM